MHAGHSQLTSARLTAYTMDKTRPTLPQDIENATLRLHELEAKLQSLPDEHPADARAALVRLVNSEKLLLQRLLDLKALTSPAANNIRQSIVTSLVLAVVILLALIGVFHAMDN